MKPSMHLNLSLLAGTFAVCRLHSRAPIPPWISPHHFYSVTRTEEELSIVCFQQNIPESIPAETDWRILKVHGPLDFGLTGILAALAEPLAKAEISIFALSTFNTDYLMVKNINLKKTLQVLTQAGHTIADI
jgi:hypothetical protein